MWIPLAHSDRFQKIENYSVETTIPYQIITDQNQENQALYIELTEGESHETITIQYEVTRLEKGAYREDEAELSRFMEATPLLPVGGRFDTLANSIIKEKEAHSELMKARALYDYVVDNVRYAKQGKYGTADANFACDAKSGNCTEFHSLFISLARSAGIPARFEVGAAIPSERDQGGINGYHCWAEFYADGQWWPVDISEANKYSNLATYYFGHHPANRISFSKGRNLLFTPTPEQGAFAFFAYPHLEVGQQIIPVKETTFSFIRKPN
jgi:transglutaminase-like putative cysteine protease